MIAWPLTISDTGSLQPSTPEEQLKANLAVLLLTPKGSRPMQPEFGSKLHLLRFLNSFFNTTKLALQFTEEAIVESGLPVEVLDMEIQYDQNGERAINIISYRNIETGEESQATF